MLNMALFGMTAKHWRDENHFKQTDLLQSDAEALVNTVNMVGIIGKGIALQFKEASGYF